MQGGRLLSGRTQGIAIPRRGFAAAHLPAVLGAARAPDSRADRSPIRYVLLTAPAQLVVDRPGCHVAGRHCLKPGHFHAQTTVSCMDADRTQRHLRLIADTIGMSERIGVHIWLRGGWAMDFFPGRVTRDHVDIDWFAWIGDASAIASALRANGFEIVSGPPPDQQLDVAKDGEEMGFGWLARGADGTVTVAGGLYAGQPWPAGMLDCPEGRIGPVECAIINPHVQIEIKGNDARLGARTSSAAERRGRHCVPAQGAARPRGADGPGVVGDPYPT